MVVELYTYNADGTLKNKIDRNGKTTIYTYDVLGRMLSQTIGTESITYTYDANGNTLTMSDATGTTTWTYDTLGRALTKNVPNIGTSTYEYDLVTGITGLSSGDYAERTTDPKGNITIKIYDKMDRVISVDNGAGITQFTYYDNGSRKSVLYPDGSNETYVYDENGQNTALVNRKADNTLIDTYSYVYDAANHQTSKTDAKGTTTFTYDKLGRLATITEPSGIKTAYTYDKAGNRIGEKKFIGEVLTQDTQYHYDASNRLLSTETKSQVLGTTDRVTYTYDANGNMLSQMTTSIKPAEIGNQATFVLEKSGASPNTLTRYTYDGFNQLKTSDDGTNKITYAYNGFGYRVEKSVTTGPSDTPATRTSRYLYEYDKVVLEVDANGNEIAKNTYGTNLLSREMADITVYYMYNGHGDVTALLNTAGDTVATYYYDVWGNILEKMESASVSNPFRYAGYQYDEETDLYYLNARYYDAKIARFLTEDTYMGRQNDPLSLNLYTYCANNPIIYVDPTGNTYAGADGGGNTKKPKNYSGKNNDSGALVTDDNTKNKKEEKPKPKPAEPKKEQPKKETNLPLEKKEEVKASINFLSKMDLREVSNGFIQGFEITAYVFEVSGNTLRSFCSDVGTGNFKNILPNVLDSLAGNRQVTVLDLMISEDTQQEFENSNEVLYTFTSLVVGTLDPTILVGGSSLISQGDDVIKNVMKNSVDNVIEAGSELGKLKSIGNGAWESTEGLIYEQGSKQGNRVLHVLEHTVPDPSKPLHTVFNVGRDKVLGIVDEAWSMKDSVTPILQKNGNQVFDIPMGRVVGTNGETTVRIVVENGTSKIVTSFPVK